MCGDGAKLRPGESIGTLTVLGHLAFTGDNNTHDAEIPDTGQSDMMDIGGTLDLHSESDILNLSFFSGNTLNGVYTITTYANVSGIFNTVMFDGNVIVDPLLPNVIGGTHRLAYTTGALVLIPEPTTLVCLTIMAATILLRCRHARGNV